MAAYDSAGRSPAHISKALTNISLGYPNNAFIADVLAPVVRVRKQTDLYYEFGYETWGLESGSDIRAPGTVADEIPGFELSTRSYYAREHALQIPVTDEERENLDPPMQADRDATELVTSKILLGRELAVRDLTTTAANYASGFTVTLSGNDQWNVYAQAASDPIPDFRTAFRALHARLFLEPTLAVIPYQVMTQLEDHPVFIDRIKYSERGILTAEIIAAIVGLPRVVVPGAGFNSANPGQAVSLGYIWGKHVILAYVPPRAGLKIPAYMYEFVWAYPGGGVQVAERWREEPRKSDLIRVSRRYEHRFIAVDGSGDSIAGYLIRDAVA